MEYHTPTIPTIDDPFPEMVVNTTQGEVKLPEAYHGKWFVLFSHPGDFTPVCTTEFVAFERLRNEFNQLNCELIGLSVEQVFCHLKWMEWIQKNIGVTIQFPIIADTLGKVAKQLGMIHPEKGTSTVRAVFIVDEQGIIRLILYYPKEVGRNLYEILRAIRALQTATKYNVATPANWPNNGIIGNQVIVPPANTVEMVKQREMQTQAGEIQCLDWWFCYKPL